MRSWLYSVGATMVRLLSAIGVLAMYARLIEKADYSALALGMLVGQLLVVVLDAGINIEILSSENSFSDEIKKKIIESSSIKIIISLPALIFVSLIIYSSEYQRILIFVASGLSVAIAAAIENYVTALKSQQRYKEELLISIAQAALLGIFAIALMWRTNALVLALIGPRLIVLIILSKKQFRVNLSDYFFFISISTLQQYFQRNRHFSLDSITTNIINQIDGLAVSFFLGKASYGAYQPSSRLMQAGIAVGGAVGGLIVPKARVIESKKIRKGQLTIGFGLAGIVVSFGLLVFLQLLIVPVFGESFNVSTHTALLLAGIVFVKYACAGAGAYLTLSKLQKARAVINAISAGALCASLAFLHNSLEEILTAILASQVFVLIAYEQLARRDHRKDKTEMV